MKYLYVAAWFIFQTCTFVSEQRIKLFCVNDRRPKYILEEKNTGLESLSYLSTNLIRNFSLRDIRTCAVFAFVSMSPQLKLWNEHFHPVSTFISLSSSR
jgi:hypothetical protein